MKCECIKESSWFKIDDSEKQNLDGGKFTFEKGKTYDCTLTTGAWGQVYEVIHDSSIVRTAGFGDHEYASHKFTDYFKIV